MLAMTPNIGGAFVNRVSAIRYSLLLCVSALWVAGFTTAYAPYVYPYAPDSSFYIEAARNFSTGNGVSVTAALDDTARDVAPMRLWPPGFPMAISAVSSTGLSAETAALTVVRLAWILLPAAVVFALSPLTGTMRALPIAALVTSAPGVLQEAYIASSDVPFLVLCIASAGLLVRAARGESETWIPWVMSGVLAGGAYVFRNAGLALFAATCASFGASWVLRIWNRRLLARRAAAWFAGFLPPVVSLLVYNRIVFDAFQPYHMPPSTIGLVDNARTYVQSQLLDLLPSNSIAQLVWDAKLFAALGVPVAAVLMFALVRCWRHGDSPRRFALLLLALYALAGAAMVVLSRTLYEWGETINVRHPMQYSWAILGLLAVLAADVGAKSRRTIWLAAVGIVFAMLVARTAYVWTDYNREVSVAQRVDSAGGNLALAVTQSSNQLVLSGRLIRSVIAVDTRLIEIIRSIENDALLASNRADVLAIETGRHVRRIEHMVDAANTAAELDGIRASLPCDRAMYVLIAVDQSFFQKHGSSWRTDVTDAFDPPFAVVEQSDNWLLFKHRATACL